MNDLTEKFLLTVPEAVKYFNIGRDKFYEMAKDPENDFILHNGNRVLIKRQAFEDYLIQAFSI